MGVTLAEQMLAELGSFYSLDEIAEWLQREGIESGDPLDLIQYYLDDIHENFMRYQLEKQQAQVVKGSLAQIAKDKGQSIAESFIDADCIVIVDVSGSMSMDDAAGGKERYRVACDELAALQANMPGKIAVLAFSNDCVFCPNGVPTFLSGGTDLAGALRFAKVADVDSVRFVVISDGEPGDPADAMKVAATYRNRIDVIYVGSELNPTGREFLKKLAKASGGQAITADRVAQLSQKVQLLLAA